MRFESLPPDPPVRRTVHYDVTYHGDELVFVIEALDTLRENPRFWCEGNAGLLHHAPHTILVFADLPEVVKVQLTTASHILIEEKYQNHHNQGLTPWGMDRVSPGIFYDVPVIPVPSDLSLKDAFPVK